MKQQKIYAEILEDFSLDQFNDAMSQNFVVSGALMPDAHSGYSLPIGAVVATDGVVVPAWVGYDIGCGMCAVPTTFDVGEIKTNADVIFSGLYNSIPVGFKHHQSDRSWDNDNIDKTETMRAIFNKNGLRQIGTLGGGNHFIEIGEDENQVVWSIVHSGSRGIGHATARHYMKLASCTDKAKEGHFVFDAGSENGIDYITDLNFCLQFALENRIQIIQQTIKQINVTCEGYGIMTEMINRNHNHAELKDGLWIHRKGATHAEKGMMGVIPGNMRDGSFIVRGKGNKDSLCSSSHGAGRVMGRKKAKQTLDEEVFGVQMRGIRAKVCADTLDEAPDAYKDIFDVMKLQKELVEIIHHVLPIINIKG